MSDVELYATAVFMCGCAGVVMGLSAMPNGKYLGGLTDGLGFLLLFTMGISFLYWLSWISKINNDFGTLEAGLAALITIASGIVADKLHIQRGNGESFLLNPKKTGWVSVILTAIIVASNHYLI